MSTEIFFDTSTATFELFVNHIKCLVSNPSRIADQRNFQSKICKSIWIFQMLPLWPSINPSLIGSLMNNGTPSATNEEQEIR